MQLDLHPSLNWSNGNMKMYIATVLKRSVLVLLVWFTMGLPSMAGIVVTLGSTTIAQGGTGTIEVRISGSSNVPDLLDNFDTTFQLIPVGNGNAISFVNPQSDSQLSDPSYVFAGVSQNVVQGNPMGAVGPSNTFIGGDFSDDGLGNSNPVGVSNANDFLLYRFDIDAGNAVAGDQFLLQLTSGSFLDDTFNPFPFSVQGSGQISISAVPEPSTWALSSLGCLAAGYWQWRRRARTSSRR